MSIINKKISLPLLVVLLGTVVASLSGQFVWTLVAAVGAAVLVSVVQNLSRFRQAIDGGRRGVRWGTEANLANEPGHSRVRKWNEEVLYSPAYKGTPGNIWNEPVSARDD